MTLPYAAIRDGQRALHRRWVGGEQAADDLDASGVAREDAVAVYQ